MMTLKELRETYLKGTASANNLNRTLIVSGIAIVWMLRPTAASFSIDQLPFELCVALAFLSFSFIIDIGQAFVHTWVWFGIYRYFVKKKERDAFEGKEDDYSVNDKEKWSVPMWILWVLKILCTIVAYCYIGCYVHFFDSIKEGFNKEDVCQVEIQPQPVEVATDTTFLNAIKTNQEAIIKLLQPKPEVKKAATSKKTAKKNSSKVKKQPLYLPLDTITCDGKEYMIVEKVK